jgi:hypothetical protein
MVTLGSGTTRESDGSIGIIDGRRKHVANEVLTNPIDEYMSRPPRSTL